MQFIGLCGRITKEMGNNHLPKIFLQKERNLKIAVFGATGGTGKEVLSQALSKGHEISALVRDPYRLSQTTPEKVQIVVGDVLNSEVVIETIQDADAVIVTLGHRADSPENTVSEGTRNIIRAMEENNLKRLVVVTSLGVGDSKNQVPFAFKIILKTALRKVMADKENQEKAVKESSLDWVIVRPGGLTDDPARGEYTFGTEDSIMAGSIPRADLAEFVIKQVIEDQFIHKAVAVT